MPPVDLGHRLDHAGAKWQIVVACTVPGAPRVKKNSRVSFDAPTKSGKIARVNRPSDAYQEWAAAAVWHVLAAWRRAGRALPIGGPAQPVWLRVHFFLPTAGFADQSNLYEGIQDVLQEAQILTNDRWVDSHDQSRRFKADVAKNARLEFELLVPA